MHQSALGGVMIDCRTDDLEREARFWSRALGLSYRRDPDDEKYVVFNTPTGRPYMEVQSVSHPSRVHLDIKTDNVTAEVKRLEKLGARVIKKVKHWCVMEAPSGHRFCVIALHPGQNIGPLNKWDE